MKAIQVTIDDRLLAALDRDDEVRKEGRSAVIRRALSDYLSRRRKRGITAAYRRAYAGGAPDELAGWEDEGTWPAT